MARTIFLFILILILGAALPPAVFAAGNAQLLLSTSRTSVGVGANFSVVASINPGGHPIDTARANLTFANSLLEVQSVSLIGKLSSSTPNNYFDNSTGVISWGGYAIQNPVTSTQGFIRINFHAKSAGSATVSTQSNSRLVSVGQEKNSGTVSTITINIDSTLPPEGTAGELIVTSPSHPDPTMWYAKNLVQLKWTTIPDASYLYSFDLEPDSVPTRSTSAQFRDFKRVSSGIHYFHIRAKKSNGSLTPVVNFPVMVDMLPPNAFSPYLDTDNEGNLNLRFGTTDNHSGIDHYSVALNGGPTAISTSPYALKDLHEGENIANVYAVDRAGNQMQGWIKFMINADGTFREIAHSQRACRGGVLCLSALLAKPVIGGIIIAIILLLLLLFASRRKRRKRS